MKLAANSFAFRSTLDKGFGHKISENIFLVAKERRKQSIRPSVRPCGRPVDGPAVAVHRELIDTTPQSRIAWTQIAWTRKPKMERFRTESILIDARRGGAGWGGAVRHGTGRQAPHPVAEIRRLQSVSGWSVIGPSPPPR